MKEWVEEEGDDRKRLVTKEQMRREVGRIRRMEEIKCVCAYTLLMRMAEGAPGKPGMQVLKAATSEKEPLPQELMPHTLNL